MFFSMTGGYESKNKLMLNKDHDPIEAFRVEYIMSRLGGKAVTYTIPKRRENAGNPYISVDDIFD